MACYLCGTYVANGAGYRRRVYTGDTSRIYFGKRVSSSFGKHYGPRTLCYECAKQHDKAARLMTGLILGGLCIGFLVIFVIPSLSNSIKSSTTNEYTGYTGSAVKITRASMSHQVNPSNNNDSIEPKYERPNIPAKINDYYSKDAVPSNVIPPSSIENANGSNDIKENYHASPYQSITEYQLPVSPGLNQPNIQESTSIIPRGFNPNRLSPEDNQQRSKTKSTSNNNNNDPRGFFTDMN